MSRDSFVFYRSFFDAITALPDGQRESLFLSICDYALNGNEPSGLDGVQTAMFALIKPVIDSNNKRYEDGKKGGEFGHLGGRPRGSKTPKGLSSKTPKGLQAKTPNVNVYVNEDDDEDVDVDGNVDGNGDQLTDRQTVRPSPSPTPNSFKPPTIEEVRMYILERGSDVLAERFFDYYSERDWTTAKGEPMKDWRAAVRYWEKTENQNQPKTQSKGKNFGETRTESLDGFVRAVNARR